MVVGKIDEIKGSSVCVGVFIFFLVPISVF